MEKLVVGILAHVDAGKTTLSEGILYLTGKIRKLGRVDHKDAYLDTYNLERERGITIFSKQAEFELGNRGITLLDTPGHVDFSAEMERTLQVLDYAILVINGADGVQGHTMTLWRLLARYQIPTFLFINKMDQDGTDKEKLLAELKKRLSDNCVDFTWEKSDLQSQFLEDVSVCDEELLEKYLETEEISTSDIRKVIKERKLFPCFFGSALKMTGVEEFLHGLEKYCETPEYPSEFGTGNIVYKETIAEPVEGVGHFEPLRHYAEVHLLLEPGEPGSGLQFFTACSEDVLDRNWQRLILTHLEEREHPGVLTGSPITDMQITLITGRAHLKHTEGGDFRQATYRAVRQGLKKAKSVLLEPYYEFRLEIPGDMIGRAMTDIQKMNGTFQQPEADEDDMMVLKGSAPVSMMRDYQTQVTSYTKGRGRLFCSLKGYAPCQNQDEIVEEIGYDSERDLDNPTGSVFCAHGAGFVVPWYEVEDYMHLEGIDESELGNAIPDSEESIAGNRNSNNQTDSGYRPPRNAGVGSYEDEEELKAIFERTFGPVKRYKEPQFKRTFSAKSDSGSYYRNSSSAKKKEKEYLLVDGYNIIYAWEDLKELADANLHAAQTKLMDILSNYQGFKKCTLILVFDAYKIEGHAEEVITYHNIHVVYTKEAETADQYIEKTVHKIGRENQVTVATSDGLEQIIIMGQGAHRMSARGLRDEIKATENQIRQQWHEKRQSSKNYLIDNISDEMAQYMKEKRLGKQ